MESGPPPRGPGEEPSMPTPAKAMITCTVACLVAVTAYTVALGPNGWVWFAWVVLMLATIGVFAIRTPR